MVIGLYPLHALLLSMLSRRFPDHVLMAILECGEVAGAVLLFRYQSGDPEKWKTLFLVGSALLYYNNSGQSGVLSSQLLKNALDGHWFLDTNRLLAAYQFCTASGFLIGALGARYALSVVYSQNMLAMLLCVFTAVQTATTVSYFAFRNVMCCEQQPQSPEQKEKLNTLPQFKYN